MSFLSWLTYYTMVPVEKDKTEPLSDEHVREVGKFLVVDGYDLRQVMLEKDFGIILAFRGDDAVFAGVIALSDGVMTVFDGNELHARALLYLAATERSCLKETVGETIRCLVEMKDG